MAGAAAEIDLEATTAENDQSLQEDQNLYLESDRLKDESQTESEPQEKLIKLPLSRIRCIVKTDPDVKIASQDAVVILAKAAELFIQGLAKEAAERTLLDKRKIVLRKHLDTVLDARDRYAFLEGVLESFDES